VTAHLASFVALSAVVILVPGPDMALVARNAIVGGRRSGIATSVGAVTGLCVWTLAASVGLAALLRASEPAFLALRLVGGAYLSRGSSPTARSWRGPETCSAARASAARSRRSPAPCCSPSACGSRPSAGDVPVTGG